MRFESVQTYGVEPAELARLLWSPTFVGQLAADARFAAPELLDHEDDGTVISQRSRYRYTGPLPPGAGRFIDAGRLSWVHELRFDRTTMSGDFVIRPDHYQDRLTASGRELIVDDPGGSSRKISGELRVHVPFVAGKVERAVVDGLREHLDTERVAFEAWRGDSAGNV